MRGWMMTSETMLQTARRWASRGGLLCIALAVTAGSLGLMCPQMCSTDAECDNGLFCDGDETCDAATMTCVDGTAPCDTAAGETCNEDMDRCDVCDANADCDDGAFCNGTETCVDGQCVDGTAPCADDGVFCNGTESCNETTDACESSGDPCGAGEVCLEASDSCQPSCNTATDCDDGLFCTIDACVNGACENTARDCDDGAFCTGVETCDEAADACVSPGDPCGANETCNETTDMCDAVPACVVDADCADDGNDCTDEVCNNGVCESQNNTALCDDGDLCTTGDTCADGACSGTPVQCPAAKECNPNNGNCEDIVCTSNSDCDDGVACTADTCDLNSNTCVFTAINANCSDGLFCNGTDTCDPTNEDAGANGCVHAGNPCDGVTPVCVEATDECRGCANDNECNDGFACTTDNCELDGSCTNVPDDDFCDDGLFCTLDDYCDPEADNAAANGCVNEGDPCNCDAPGNPCAFVIAGIPASEQRLICNEGTDGCDECTANADCSDSITCTLDTCNGGTGICTNAADDDECPDPSFCDGVDTCDPNNPDADANGCVQPGDPCGGTEPICNETDNMCEACVSNAQCSDGVDCTDDTCNGPTGECVNTPNDANCGAGEFCDAVDDCQPIP